MSNGSSDTWTEYSRLVLAELERLNKMGQDLASHLQKQDLSIQGLNQKIDNIDKYGAEYVRVMRSDFDKRLLTLEQKDAKDDATTKYRNWLIGALFLLLTSVALPLIQLFFR